MVDMKPPMQAPAPLQRRSPLAHVLRRVKYYVFINTFICSVALASFTLVSHVQRSSNSTMSVASLLAVYVTSLLRIVAMVRWFNWIGSKKSKILGDKRIELTSAQRQAIYLRILWLVVPTECVSFWATQPIAAAALASYTALDARAFLVEFAAFIPKSLVFEVLFDLFHYAAHWVCHQSTWLYQHAHKRHHMHLHPCPLSTYEQDGIDLCLTNVLPFILAASLGFPLSPVQLHLIFAYKTYVEVAGHSGLEIKGFSFPQLPWVNVLSICLRVHDHDLHHTHPKFNFAKRFALWDKLFGTFRPGRPLLESSKP